MLIFHRFPDAQEATAFAVAVAAAYPDLGWVVCSTQAHSNQLDPFPYELTAPIVLIDRPYRLGAEAAIEAKAAEFRGEFAGT